MTTIRTPAKIIPRAFPGIKPEEVQEIIVNSRISTYPPETVICKENEIEFVFYMILEGEPGSYKGHQQFGNAVVEVTDRRGLLWGNGTDP